MKSFIFVLASAFAKLALIGGFQESLSAAIDLRPGICEFSKSNSWIQAIYQRNRALDKSVPDQFYYATKTLMSIFKINLTLYSKYLTFLKVFNTSWHFCLIASYFFFATDQNPLLYFKECHFYLTSYISTLLHFFKYTSTAAIMSPAFSI